MDERETVVAFVVRIKDVKDGLADIGEAVSDSDLVSITLSGMCDEFQMFVTRLAAREKAPTFEDLTGILLQEEERRQNLNPQSDDLVLMVKQRPFKGKQPEQQSQQKGGTSQKNSHKASNEDDVWYVDSRASSHMTGKKKFFDSLEESTHGSKIYLGDDSGYEIKGYGVIPAKLSNGRISHLKNVLYVPGIKKNLISVSMMTDQDMQFEFFKTHCVIKDYRNEIVATGMRVGSLYKLDAKSIPKRAMVVGRLTAEQLWHQRFGHLNLQDLMLLQKKGMVEGLPIFRNIQLNCDGCALVYSATHTIAEWSCRAQKQNLGGVRKEHLQGKGLSNSFWPEAINTVVYLKNRSPTRYLSFKTPFEYLHGFKLALNHLRVFGSKAFTHIPKADRKKLDPKAVRCIFVSYGTEFKACKLFNPESRKTFASRDVVFHEQVQEGKDDIGDDWHIPLLLDENNEDEREQEQKEEQKEEQEEGDNASPVIAEENKFEVSPLRRRSGRKTQKPLKLRDYALMSNVLNIVEPTNYKEASQFKEWRAAMNEEMESILRNDTWDLVDLSKN
eukprot:PITA_23650